MEFPYTRAHAVSSDLSEPSVSRCWKVVSSRPPRYYGRMHDQTESRDQRQKLRLTQLSHGAG
jgi:hypothetical protein